MSANNLFWRIGIIRHFIPTWKAASLIFVFEVSMMTAARQRRINRMNEKIVFIKIVLCYFGEHF